MNYFDPARKRLGNGLPTLAWGQAIPSLVIEPREGRGWDVLVMLVTYERGGGTAHWHRTQCSELTELTSLLASWRGDPEATIAERWPEFEAPGAPAAKPETVAAAQAAPVQMGLF